MKKNANACKVRERKEHMKEVKMEYMKEGGGVLK
jgi:hypothetical protein